jgi:hypothetical protein
MGGGYVHLRDLGSLIIWSFKLFKGKWKDCKNHKYSFEVGCGFIILIVLVLYLID